MIHTITIPNWLPTRINELLNVHWSKAHRRKQQDFHILSGYVTNTPKASSRRRMTMTIVLGKGMRTGDNDAYFKSILDALVKLKLLINDSPNWLDLQPVKFQRAERSATIIELEDIESVAKLPVGYADGCQSYTARPRGKK